MTSRPARQRWFDRSRSVFAVDVTDRPTARVDPHTHTRERNHRAFRSRATPERVTVSRDAVVIGQSSIAFTRSVAAHTHEKHTKKQQFPQPYTYTDPRVPHHDSCMAISRSPGRGGGDASRVAQSKRGVCVKSPVMIRRLRLTKIPRALFRRRRLESSRRGRVFDRSNDRANAGKRWTSEKIKKHKVGRAERDGLISSHSFHFIGSRATGRPGERGTRARGT